jgi:putative endonuclease
MAGTLYTLSTGWGRSSVGRAPQWHCGGQGFESPRLHHPPLGTKRSELRMASHPYLRFFMYYAYILESSVKPGEFYRGSTDDLQRRVAEHNAGKCGHTSKFKPWKVRFYGAFETMKLAQEFEKYLKSGSGHAFAKRRFISEC